MATIENFILKFKTEGTAGIQSARDSVNGLNKDVVGLNGVLGRLGITAAGLATGIGAAATVLTTLALKAIDAADQLQDLGDATGISTSKLLSLRGSIVEAGGDIDAFQKVATKLTVAIGDAATGNEKAQKAFKDLGVFVTDSSGKLRSSNDILDDTLKALAKIEDPAIRSAKAVDLLGKEAAKIDWTKVKAGKDAITDEQIRQIAEYRGEWDALKVKIEETSITIVGKFIQAIKQIGKEKPEKGSVLDLLSLPFELGFELARQGNLRTQREEAVAGGLSPEEIAQENQRLAGRRPMTGGFGGPSEAQLKAIAESQKRVRDSLIATRLQQDLQAEQDSTAIALQGANERIALDERANSEIRTLTIQARAEVAKAIETIRANDKLNSEQQNNEIAAKETEIYTKLATDITKIRNKQTDDVAKYDQKIRLQQAQALQQQLDDDLKAWSDYYKEIEQANLQSSTQVLGLQAANKELVARADLQRQLVGLSSEDQAKATKLFELERQRLAELEKLKERRLATPELQAQREKEINDLFRERVGLINEEYDTRKAREEDFSAGVRDVMKRYEESFTPIKRGGMVTEQIFQAMERSIDSFVETGKFKFGDFARSIIMNMIKIELKTLGSSILRSLLGSVLGFFGGGGGFGTGSAFGNLDYGGFLASGGPAMANKAYVVGEKGPELFIPRNNGTVLPNGTSLGGTAVTNVNYSIQAVDAASFRALVSRDPQFIYAVTEQGRRSQPSRRFA